MNKSLAVVITTTFGRENVLHWVVKHLCKDVKGKFHLYIYNDHALPLNQSLTTLIYKQQKRKDVKLFLFNDTGKLNGEKIGCGGARHFLFEQAKINNHNIIVSLDDDMQLMPNWMDNIIHAMKVFPNHCVFTGIVKGKSGDIQHAGSNMQIINKTLYRSENKKVTPNFSKTEWGPMGCMAFCRSALSKDIVVPSLYIRDDAAFYLLLKKMGINETIVVPNAHAIHKPIPVPNSNLRIPEEMAKEVIWFRDTHGIELGY
ncbi:glycosyltransferase [Rossellomorea vietnamensis]|uniref:Glycosyltransferase n=1 Tax=Rossellomorea vietnamensis TaxID=218284 RepID=A0ACD4C9H3_9BACI|nr:glycosyltransferase [Rossellomorea vietnamensis]UXH45329.1 glycosyltransferase [Rossellomorea vietnamensis]